MLALGYPKMNFQLANDMAHRDLLATATEMLQTHRSSKQLGVSVPETHIQTEGNRKAFQVEMTFKKNRC